MLKNCDGLQREGVIVKQTDVICSDCGAGFRRLELSSRPGHKGEYRCPACNSPIEVFDGSRLIAYRLTIEPSIRAIRD
jgi:DNA-directed RNA polymerase subunit RPC12/RpoP